MFFFFFFFCFVLAECQGKRILQTLEVTKFEWVQTSGNQELAQPLMVTTIALYQSVIEAFLPTPEKFHYLFNLRDVSKVIHFGGA